MKGKPHLIATLIWAVSNVFCTGIDGMSWLKSYDLSCELEVDTLYCTHADAQQPMNNLSGQKHFWNHVLYMNILMIKVRDLLV